MKCPACFNSLTRVTVGGLAIDACRGGCGGLWFDAFELDQVDGPQDRPAAELVNIEQDPLVQVDFNRKRDCPRCEGLKLRRHFFSPRRLVEVDTCPGCGGCWLDAGELDKIRAELAADAAAKVDAARRVLTPSMIREIYQMRTRQAQEPPR
jgi:Zn-finger nucleic acid-binding protein